MLWDPPRGFALWSEKPFPCLRKQANIPVGKQNLWTRLLSQTFIQPCLTFLRACLCLLTGYIPCWAPGRHHHGHYLMHYLFYYCLLAFFFSSNYTWRVDSRQVLFLHSQQAALCLELTVHIMHIYGWKLLTWIRMAQVTWSLVCL